MFVKILGLQFLFYCHSKTSHMSELNLFLIISPFDIDGIQIEQCVNMACVTWKPKTRPEHYFNMHSNVKQDLIYYS